MEGKPIKLVVSMPLQMGRTELPLYFNLATETAQDVADEYARAKEFAKHYLKEWTKLTEEHKTLPSSKLSLKLVHQSLIDAQPQSHSCRRITSYRRSDALHCPSNPAGAESRESTVNVPLRSVPSICRERQV